MKKWKDDLLRNLLGSKITYEYIWKEREADEGSEYFLHTVPMEHTHDAHDYVGTIVWDTVDGYEAAYHLLNPEGGSWAMCR